MARTYDRKKRQWVDDSNDPLRPIDARMGDAMDAGSLGYTNISRGMDGKIDSAKDATGQVVQFIRGQAPERMQLSQQPQGIRSPVAPLSPAQPAARNAPASPRGRLPAQPVSTAPVALADTPAARADALRQAATFPRSPISTDTDPLRPFVGTGPQILGQRAQAAATQASLRSTPQPPVYGKVQQAPAFSDPLRPPSEVSQVTDADGIFTAHTAGGGTVTGAGPMFQGFAKDAGIFVDGKRVTHDSKGNLVADVVRPSAAAQDVLAGLTVKPFDLAKSVPSLNGTFGENTSPVAPSVRPIVPDPRGTGEPANPTVPPGYAAGQSVRTGLAEGASAAAGAFDSAASKVGRTLSTAENAVRGFVGAGSAIASGAPVKAVDDYMGNNPTVAAGSRPGFIPSSGNMAGGYNMDALAAKAKATGANVADPVAANKAAPLGGTTPKPMDPLAVPASFNPQRLSLSATAPAKPLDPLGPPDWEELALATKAKAVGAPTRPRDTDPGRELSTGGLSTGSLSTGKLETGGLQTGGLQTGNLNGGAQVQTPTPKPPPNAVANAPMPAVAQQAAPPAASQAAPKKLNISNGPPDDGLSVINSQLAASAKSSDPLAPVSIEEIKRRRLASSF